MNLRKLIVGSVFFIAAAFALSLKLLLPTPINVYVQEGSSQVLIEQVQGFYNWSDMATVCIAAVILGWSGSLILSSSSKNDPGSTNGDIQAWKTAFEQKKGTLEDVAKTLKEDEATVLRAIIASDGMITQAELVKRTGLPKSTVSNCLDALETRGLVERRRRGMGNVILLK